MNVRHCKRTLSSFSVALSLGLAGPVGAQEAVPTAEPAAPAAATPAAVAAADSTGPEEVIVTARRIEERLQDVPISITTFSQKELEAQNVYNAKDLASYTPGLSINSRYGSDNTTFSIRGFYQEQRTTATVGTYFAEVVAPRGSGATFGGDGAGPGSLFDLQNVQVLKGPQGTLFGRNSTGGAVLLVPKKPTSEYEGYLEDGFGDLDMWRTQGVVNIPATENLRFRFGFDHNERDGYMKNAGLLGAGPRGDAMGSVDYTAVRGSVVADITPDIENYSIFSYSKSESTGTLPKVTKCYPGAVQFISRTPSEAIPLGDLSCAQIARESAAGDFWTVSNRIPDAGSLTEQWQAINTTTWAATDSLKIKNIVSYAELKGVTNIDLFGNYLVVGATPGKETSGNQVTGFAFTHANGLNNHTNAQSTFVEEFQLQGTAFDSRLIWQTGLYLELSDPLGVSGVQTATFTGCEDVQSLNCQPFTGGQSLGSGNTSFSKTKFEDKAAYAQASYDLTKQLTLTAGLRYTVDETKTHLNMLNGTFKSDGTASFTCANATASNKGTVTEVSELLSICDQKLSQKSDAPTWVVGLDYKPIDNLMLYGKYSRGYRQGGIALFGPDPVQKYDPETVDTYEVGGKTSWRGALPGSFNVAVFHNDFTDQQLQIGVACDSSKPGFTTPCSGNAAVLNAGSSTLDGLEADGSIYPVKGLQLGFSYAYLKTKIDEITLPTSLPPYNSFTAPAEGDEIPQSIPHSATASINYILPLPVSIGDVSVGLAVVYKSEYRYVPDSVPGSDNGLIPETTFANLNLNWADVMGKPVELGAFVTNVTNEKIYLTVQDNQTRGFVSSHIGEPRLWGMRVRYKFG